MGVRIVMPLRVLLPCLAVWLAAAGAAAIGVAAASTASGFVMRQADGAVRACASSMLGHGLVVVPGTSGPVAVPGTSGPVAVPGSGLAPGPAGSGICGLELVSARGQVLIPAASAAGTPAIPASGSWLAAHLAGPVTVPGARGGDWRVVITVVHYQAQRMLFVYGPDDLRYVISGRTGHGSSGMLIVMAGLAGTGQVAAGYAAAAGTVLVLLAAVAFAVTRAILRPLRAAAGLTANAGRGAGGRPGDVLAGASMPADGPLGRSDMMLAKSMRERLDASRAAEAAARRSAADMSGHLAKTCLQLRRPVSIVYGFTGYLRQQDKPQPASLDRMLRRVADEITRMETLAEGLHMPPAGESTGPDRRPGRPATGPAARDWPQDNRQPPASASHAK